MNNKEFDVKTLWRVLVSFWLIICIATALGAVAGGAYSLIVDRPTYTGYASFWVNATTSSGVSQSSTMGAAQLASNYVELADGSLLLTRTVKDGELDTKWNCSEDVAVSRLGSMISAGKTTEESFMFTVYIRSGDKQLTYDAIDAVQQTMMNVIAEVNGSDASEAEKYVTRVGEVYSIDDIVASRPSALKKAVIAAAAAFVLSYVVCFIFYVFGNRVTRTEQLEDNFETDVVGLPVAFYNPRKAEKLSPVTVMHAYLTAGGMVRRSLGDDNGVILLTSGSFADPDAALSIAESYAASGKNTLVVECDSRLPMLLDMLEGEKEGTVGIDAFFNDGVAPTVINIDDCLDVITVGEKGSTGYLSVHSLIDLVKSVKDEYDIVILSLPSVDFLVDVVDLGLISDRAVIAVNQRDELTAVERVHTLLTDLGVRPCALYYLPL